MRRINFIFFVLVFNSVLSQEFTYSYKTGDAFKRTGDFFSSLFPISDTNYIALRKPLYDLHYKNTLETFSSDLNPLETKLIKQKLENKKLQIWKIAVLENRLHVFFWKKPRIGNSIIIYQQEFDKSTLSPITAYKNAITISNHGIFSDTYGLDFYISEDKKKVLLMSSKFIPTLNEMENYFAVYNANFDLVLENTIHINNIKDLHEHEDVIVSNSGEIYTVINIEEPNKNSYSTKIFKISANTNTITYNISKQDVYPQELHLTENAEGNILCLGTYKNDTTSDNIKGTLFIEIDHNKSDIIQDHVIPFDYKQIQEYARFPNPSNELLEEHLIIKDVVELDGQVLLLLEEYEETREQTEMGGLLETTYNYNDIIICSFSKVGEINWIQKFDKKQAYDIDDEPTPGSFSSYVYGNSLYLLLSNTDSKPRGIQFIKVNSKGGFESSKLEKVNGEGFIIRPVSMYGHEDRITIPIQIDEKTYRILDIKL